MLFDLIYFLFDFCWFTLILLTNVMNLLIFSIVLFIFIAKIMIFIRPKRIKPFFSDSPHPLIIAHQGAGLDVEPNSKASIEYVRQQNITNILVNLNMTNDEKLVVLDDDSLIKSNVNKSINEMSFDEIKKLSNASNKRSNKDVLTLGSFIELVNTSRIKAFVMSRRTDGKFIENFQKHFMSKKELDASNIIFCSQSLLTIYKFKKTLPDMNFGLWLDPLHQLISFKSIVVPLQFMYGLILKHALIPLLGIQCVFVEKGDYDAQMFKSKNTIQIAYFVNSTIEKIHYQENVKVQAYLTSSLRSEPKNIGWKSSSY